jgi:hypothetical protein
MASPLRSWSPKRLSRGGGATTSWPAGARRARASRGAGVEVLEGRQLFAASLVSIDSSGLASSNDNSIDPDISSNGRFVVFASRATDIVAEDTNTTFDIYLRDLQTGVTRLVSVNTAGTGPGNANSTDASVSDDGRFVVFTSSASNLVAGDNNSRSDVFVRDLVNNTTRAVSTNAAGTGFGNGDSLAGVISDNGHYAVFASDATNLAAADSTPTRDIFVRNLVDNTTQLVSTSTLGAGGNAQSDNPSISATGQYITFLSLATDLGTSVLPGPGINAYLFNTGFNVDDPLTPGPGTVGMSLVSTTGVSGSGGAVDPVQGSPTVSDNGRFVAYTSTAADLVTGDINGVSDVFRKDLFTGINLLASQSSGGIFGNGASARPKISNDGRFIAFSSTSSNLAGPDNGPGPDVFLRDVENLTTVLVSANRTNTGGTGTSAEPAMNDDGTVVAFSSAARDLVTEPTEDTQVYIASTPLPGNDTTRPIFILPVQPTPQVQAAQPVIGGTTLPFTVLYQDDVFIDTGTLGSGDVIVTGPNGFNETATLFALTSNNGGVATAVYTVPAPGGLLTSADNGTYTVTVQGNEVADRARNFVLAGGTGTFALSLPASENVLPQPTFTGGSPAVGDATYEFTVTYEERGGIDFQTFGNDDVVVTGPAGFSQNAVAVASTPLSATTTSVIYRITAPGGVWDANDAGVYTVSVLPNGVLDVAGNAVQDGPFGSFTALGADLVAIKLRNLRSGAISGVDQQKASIRVLNQGSFPTTVPVAVTLYTSLDETLDPGDATIGTFIEERPINPDSFREMKVRFTYPQVPEGNYFVLSQVDSANAVIEQSETNNIASSFRQVGLSAPFVDLVPTLVPFAGTHSRVTSNEAMIKIRNAGNAPVDADVVVNLTAIRDGTTTAPSEPAVASVPLKVTLRPGQVRTYRLPFTFPIDFNPGTYTLVANVDATNVVAERDEVNNRVVSLSHFAFA